MPHQQKLNASHVFVGRIKSPITHPFNAYYYMQVCHIPVQCALSPSQLQTTKQALRTRSFTHSPVSLHHNPIPDHQHHHNNAGESPPPPPLDSFSIIRDSTLCLISCHLDTATHTAGSLSCMSFHSTSHLMFAILPID